MFLFSKKSSTFAATKGSKKNDDPYYLHINYGWGNGYANEAYILSGNKKFIDHAEEYSNGKLYQYNLSYATLTYPSEKNWSQLKK